jgi:DNA replication protein DnaC
MSEQQRGGVVGATLRQALGRAPSVRAAGALAEGGGAEKVGEPAVDAAGCPDCGGRGWVLVAGPGAGGARRCPCLTVDPGPRLRSEAGIPSRYQACTFENFNVDNPLPTQKAQLMRAVASARQWVDGFLDLGGFSESGLLFVGPPGVGKTHLAAAALCDVIRRYRVRGRFVDFTTLIYQIQSTFDAGSPETKQSVLDPIVEAEVLVLDELGAQKPSPWVSEVLYLILNGRYTRRLPTLFTSNYYLDAATVPAEPTTLDRGAGPPVSERGADLLDSRIPRMLVSRLWEMARPVVLAGVKDFRREVKSHQLTAGRG